MVPRPPSPYAGSTVVFATRHGKANLARPAFARTLAAHVVAVRGLDTDRFGTFTRDIPRTLAPADAALAKAELGIVRTGVPYALASEGSYSSLFGAIGQHHEVLLFRDADRDLTLTVETRVPAAVNAAVVSTIDDAVRVAHHWGFPRIGVALIGDDEVRKPGRDASRFALALAELLERGGTVRLERDFRAHHNPARRAVIRQLAGRLATRLAAPCPECDAPGWGEVARLPGALCRDCGEPTGRPRAHVLGCSRCEYRVEVARPDRADPGECDGCNP